MSSICLHLPDYLFEYVTNLAERENLSTNQLITLVLAEKVSQLRTDEERAAWKEQGYMDELAAVIMRAKLEPFEETDQT